MRRSINNLISIIICFAMLMSLILPINTTHALIKDENIIKLADNSTVDDYKNVLEDNNFGTRYSGRIWTDKSVYANNSDVSNITLDNKFNVQYDEDFLTVFSALGSSQLIQSKNTMDVLIVIDASGSMGEDVKDHLEHTDEKTRIAHTRMQMTLDSVNSLIDTVMELNPYNRICIVAYGATAYTLMDLGHYEKVDGTNAYITMENILNYNEKDFIKSGAAAFTLRVKAKKDGQLYEHAIRNNYTSNLSASKIQQLDSCIGFHTNMQAGVYLGFNELYENVDHTRIRTPMAIIMTDGGSNFALKRANSAIVGDEWYNVPIQKTMVNYTIVK